jgi:hypothetical protein
LGNIFKQGRQQLANAFAVSEYQRDAFVQDKIIFFEWILCKDKENILEETQVNLGRTANENCQ